MKRKKLKVIKNKYAGSNLWMQDPTIPQEEIDKMNAAWEYMSQFAKNPEEFRKELIWKKKEVKPQIRILKPDNQKNQ